MKNMLTTAFLQMTFFQAEISCLVKMSWSIKQIVCFSFNQRRVKAILDAFFKNSHARVEDILNVRTDGLNCVIYLCYIPVICRFVIFFILSLLTDTNRLKSSICKHNIAFSTSNLHVSMLQRSPPSFLIYICRQHEQYSQLFLLVYSGFHRYSSYES